MASKNRPSTGVQLAPLKKRHQRDDSASDPYSDELLDEADSPEILATGDDNLEEINAEEDSDLDQHDDGEEDDEGDLKSGSVDGYNSDDAEDEEDEVEEEDDGAVVQRKIANVSFGALAKAHTALDTSDGVNNKRKRGQERSSEAEEKLRALRDRLRELQGAKGIKNSASTGRKSTKTNEDFIPLNAGDSQDQQRSEDLDSDSDSDDGIKKGAQSRSSKHAPQIQSSKKAVTRKREVVDVPRVKSRDPRFDPLSGTLDQDKVAKKYAFVSEYQASELSSLKALVKDRHASRTMTESERDELKRKIASMESKAKAQKNADRLREVEREHKKKERESVAQGKQPYFLKKSEVKKQALVRKFESMKSGEKERALERRRLKLSQKERRSMPDMRRNA